MLDLPIVDPHQHLWDFKRAHYGWLMDQPLAQNPAGDCASIAKPYGIEDYLADTRGYQVTKVVHVEAGADAAQALDETKWLQEIAEEHGYPQGMVAFAQLHKPGVENLLAAHCEHKNVRGIRQIINWHPDSLKTYNRRDLLDDAAWRKGFALLARHGLSFDTQIYPSQMAATAELAARNENTQLIINHCGMPTDRDRDGLARWKNGMALLARQPNVSVKISGLAMIDRSWTAESIRPFVLQTIDLFGPARCMFASNFPVDKLYGSFSQHYEAYNSIVADFSDGERRALFGDTALKIYRL